MAVFRGVQLLKANAKYIGQIALRHFIQQSKMPNPFANFMFALELFFYATLRSPKYIGHSENVVPAIVKKKIYFIYKLLLIEHYAERHTSVGPMASLGRGPLVDWLNCAA